MSKPANLAEAEAIAPGLTPVYAEATALMVDVETPAGKKLAIDDHELIDTLRQGIRDRHELTLLRSDRAMTDCRPVSLFSIQTVRQLSEELGTNLDKRRFRANIYLDLGFGTAFGENEFVGHTLQIGNKAVIALTDRDPRCKMITLDPDTAQANPEAMRHVARVHDGKAGVYGAVLVEGTIRSGDQVQVMQ
ncbi:MAG: MOSC domain-containing protein [Bryobacteraceae bacterium]